MELIKLLRIVRRWLWPILALMLVTTLVLTLRVRTAQPVYEAQVKLQLTAPTQTDVDLYDRYRATNLRDEMTVARNNFTELLKSREVRDRALKALGLPDTDYELDVRTFFDYDFIYVKVRAATPRQAEAIANAHVNAALDYYAEARAKPATVTKDFLADQLRGAEKDLRSAEQALMQYQVENGLASLDAELASQQKLLEQLELLRDQQLVDGRANREIKRTESLLDQLQVERERAFAAGETAKVERLDQVIADYSKEREQLQTTADPVAVLESVIAKRRERVARLIELGPRNTELQQDLKQAQAAYQRLSDKYTEAMLKENTIKGASNLQIIEPAIAPTTPAPQQVKLLFALGLAGSLILGLVLAFVLEAIMGTKLITSRSAPSAPATTVGL